MDPSDPLADYATPLRFKRRRFFHSSGRARDLRSISIVEERKAKIWLHLTGVQSRIVAAAHPRDYADEDDLLCDFIRKYLDIVAERDIELPRPRRVTI